MSSAAARSNGVAEDEAAAAALNSAKHAPLNGMVLGDSGSGEAHSTNGSNRTHASGESSSEPSEPRSAEHLLQRLPLFEQLPQHHLGSLAQACERREVAANQELVRQGESGDALFVLMQGSATVHVLGKGEASGGAADPRYARALCH